MSVNDATGGAMVTDDTESDSTTTSTQAATDAIQRSTEVWFDDGNVVVVAQNVAFRFHKSVLSHHSIVFKDMFAVPQPPSPPSTLDGGTLDYTETMDGCPVVRVSDSSHDFRELLLAIYGGVNFLHPERGKAIPFFTLAALARLSHKYQLDDLLEAVLSRLRAVFTTDFKLWPATDPLRESVMPTVHACAIEAVNLLRLLGRIEMLPVAFYCCCQLRPRDLVMGVDRADGTRERLTTADLIRCLDAQKTLRDKSTEIIFRYYDEVAAPSDGCSNRSLCASLIKGSKQFVRSYIRDIADSDPLNDYFECISESMCSSCVANVHCRVGKMREAVWDGLPDIFDLVVDGWVVD